MKRTLSLVIALLTVFSCETYDDSAIWAKLENDAREEKLQTLCNQINTNISALGDIVTALNANNVDVSFSEIKSNYGHDAFLLEKGQLNYLFANFLSESVVEDLMMENIATIKADADVVEAAKLMLDRHVTHIPVVTDENKLIGIVTSWDLSKSIATDSNHLTDIMTTTVKYCNAGDTIEEIARYMRKFDISCLPVVDEDMVVLGLITTDQISNLLS